MTTRKRQHTSPILIESPEDPLARPLYHVPLQSHDINESRLQGLLAQYPNLIPIDEIEPAMGPLINIGREVPTPAGPMDLLFISPTGYLTVVETKLWRNPEARRSVVGQIIDYVKEMAQWTYEDLDKAVRRSQLPQEYSGRGIIDILNSQGYDIAESQFVDTVSLNLSRGQILLIIAGDGIRRDVEAMTAYLQSTPNLFFTLSLLELALYRIRPEQEWPLFVQPRIVARTAEVVRAVVEVKTNEAQSVEVTLPDKEEKLGSRRRRVLSERTFMDELEQLTDQQTRREVADLLESLFSKGLVPTWRASSVSVRLPDPGTSEKDFTIVIVKTDGSFWLGYLDYFELANYSPSIWKSYLEEVIKLTGAKPSKKHTGTLPENIRKLLNNKGSFLIEVEKLIKLIESQSRINS
jgi:hypothetical protein